MVQKSLNTTTKSAFGIAGFLATVMVGTWAWALPYDEFDRRPAVYSVPVIETLEPYASYPIRQIGFSIDGKGVFIGYHLPKELTGLTTSEIILTGELGAGDSFEVKGTGGAVGLCQKATAERKISCKIKYGKLEFDPAARRKFLRAEYTNPLELAGRVQVARFFASEPIGILSFNE